MALESLDPRPPLALSTKPPVPPHAHADTISGYTSASASSPMSCLDHFLNAVRRRLCPHYRDGKLHQKPHNQFVYDSDETRAEFIPFKAAYMCATVPYDNLGFWDYPARVGWKVHRYDHQCHSGKCPPGRCTSSSRDAAPSEPPGTKRGRYGLQVPAVSRLDGSVASVAEKVAFLQAWLFFGALAETCSLCELALNLEEAFISENVVNTAALNALPRRLYTATHAAGLAGTKQLRLQLYAIVRHVQLIIARSGDWEDEHEYTFPECEVLCTIYILLRVLALNFLCHSPHPNLDPNDGMHISFGDVADDWKPEGQTRMRELTWDRLAKNGWCKSELQLLHGDDVFIFSSLLERPAAPRAHGDCTETRCIAYQTDEKSYKTAHISAQCECAPVSVDPAQLRDALGENKIPKVVISHDLQLSIVDADDYPFVALSHVWADGLGNPFQNALPRCQLQRLRDFVTNLCKVHSIGASDHRPIALWIDTLCIPVADHLKEYRRRAIRLLAQTFHDAAAVLIIDRELCLFQSQNAPILEVGIRIMCSGWMKRLWTLQEAAFAAELSEGRGKMYFEMGDGPVFWNRSLREFQYKPSQPRPRPTKPTALTVTVHEMKSFLLFDFGVVASMIDRLPSIYDLRKPGSDAFQRLCRALQTRSTSKSEDEPVCLASLLGLDVADILGAETAAERMSRFYLLMRELPTAIIFAQLGIDSWQSKNLQHAPFRWAPKSLLSLEQPMNIDIAYGAQRFAESSSPIYGLCETDGLHIQHSGFVLCDSEVVLHETCTIQVMGGQEQYRLTWYGKASDPPHHNMALVFQTDICSNVAIVCIEERRKSDSDTEFYVTIVGHGYVRVQAEVTEGEVIQGVLASPEQKWCLT